MNTKQAADYFGSKSKLAAALGIKPSAVTMWGDEIPELRQYQIEQLTKGELKRSASDVDAETEAAADKAVA